MSTTVHWSSIRSFKGSQNKGFEQLCFQLALKKFESEGHFTEIDDTGGGDGVEFFLKRAGGREWGWQAKFYDGSPRLSVSNRKRKIIMSLQTALKRHPKLDRWILCTNTQFTREEQKWFDSELPKHIGRRRKIELEHWSEGKIISWLDEPVFCGIRFAFFGDLQLSKEWFSKKLDKFYNLVAEKFEEQLHVKDHELYYDYLGKLLINTDFVHRCTGGLEHAKEQYQRLKESIEKLNHVGFSNGQWPSKELYLTKCAALLKTAELSVKKLSDLLKLVSPNAIRQAQEAKREQYCQPLQELIELLRDIYIKQPPEYTPNPESHHEQEDKHRFTAAKNKIYDPISVTEKMIAEIGYTIRDINLPQQNFFHLLGNAGIGKTHICTSMGKEYINAGLPAIFIPAIKFDEHSSIEQQVLTLLGISSKYSFDEFLETLNTLGRMYNIRVPIIFDGLNESTNDQGTLNPKWKLDLPGIESEVNKLSNVVLFTTSRKSYRAEIWANRDDGTIYSYTGIHNEHDRRDLIKKYFTRYRIVCDLTYLSFSQFSHPLFLKIFCETKSIPGKNVYLQLGADSIYDIFEQFIKKCNVTVFKRVSRYGAAPLKENKTIATTYAIKIGQLLWESKARVLPFDAFYKIFKNPPATVYNRSKAKALIDEGLLLVRDWDKNQEHVGFTYDMIAGYCIAEYLLGKYKARIKEFVSSKIFYNNLLLGRYESIHPLGEDILECFIALLPVKTGMHLLDLVPRKQQYLPAIEQSFRAFFKISGKYIGAAEIAKAKNVFKRSSSEKKVSLLEMAQEILFVPTHPLNFLFFSRQFFELTLVEKDLCWSEYIRGLDDTYLDQLILQFEEKNNPGSRFTLEEETEVNDIVAEFVAWSLSSNVIAYRKKAAKALYLYGRRDPEKFFNLAKRFVKADDIYLREYLLGICFGLVSSWCQERTNKNLVCEFAKWTYTMFFQNRAPFSTTHILLRDYASQLIEKAVRTLPEVTSTINITDTRPPYTRGGIRRWGSSQDKNDKEYRDGNSLIDYFFEKDHLPHLTRSDYYKPDDKLKLSKARILWRAYQLGYSFKRFEDIDTRIARWNGYGRDENRVEKYGQKYTWIAFYELAGYLEDNGQLEKYFESDFPTRKFGEGFDPTFPAPTTDRMYFDRDIIGNRKTSIYSWLQKYKLPDLTPLLVVDDLDDTNQEYVLLRGFKVQTDEAAERQVFFWINAIFSNDKNINQAKKSIFGEDIHGDIVPSFHEPVYAGEYPFSEYFPELGVKELSWAYTKRRVKRRYTKMAIVKGTRTISAEKEKEFWDTVQEKYHFFQIRNKGFVREFTDFDDNPVTPITVNVVMTSQAAALENSSIEQAVARELRARHYSLKTFVKEVWETENVTQPVEVFVPVIKSSIGKTIAKEIAVALELDCRPGSTDLYDKEGKRASYTFHHGDKYNNNHLYIYLRKDLLLQFMEAKKYKMFWSMEGERNHYTPDHSKKQLSKKPWRKFNKIYEPDFC